MLEDLLGTPSVAFLFSLVVVFAIYLLGRSKTRANDDKSSTYACGEKAQTEDAPVSIHIFEFAAAFLIFDVIAIMLIFSFGASTPLLPLLYIGLAAVALYTIPVLKGRR